MKLEERVGALHASESECAQLSSEFQVCTDRLDKTSEMSLLLEAKVDRLEAKVNDQIMDLEAARLSEAEVERSLTETVQAKEDLETDLRHAKREMQQRVEAIESRLRHTINEMQTVTEQLTEECRQKGQKVAELEEAENELSELRKLKSGLEFKRDELSNECNKLQKWNIGLESETAALKEKLGNVEKDYSEDRDKIASALAGFDEEMTKAGAMMKEMKEVEANLMDELMKEKANVKDLIDSHEKAAKERAMGDEAFIQNMENEREHFETKMNEAEKAHAELMDELEKEKLKVKDLIKSQVDEVEDKTAELSKAKEKVAKYQQDIGVYEEAIRMLQKQVDILQQMADAECDKCTETTKVGGMRFKQMKGKAIEEARQEYHDERQELLSRVNTQKLEHENAMAKIVVLEEKCLSSEESMGKLEKLCTQARRDLFRLRDQKNYLEGSLGRSIQYIKDMMQSQGGIDVEVMDAVEIVATSQRSYGAQKDSSVRFHEDVTFANDFDEISFPVTEPGTAGTRMLGHPMLCKDIGSDLDALLTCIEGELGVGECVAPEIESQSKQSGGEQDLLATKSW